MPCLSGGCVLTTDRSGMRHQGPCTCLEDLAPAKRHEVRRTIGRLREIERLARRVADVGDCFDVKLATDGIRACGNCSWCKLRAALGEGT